MRKLLNKPWFVALLALAAVGFVVYSLMPYFSSPSQAAALPPEPAAPEPEATTPADETPVLADIAKLIPQAKVNRDPFVVKKTGAADSAAGQAETAQASAEPDIIETFRLSALWTQNGKTLIYLNDQVHSVGDAIGRIKIESASAKGVWLSHSRGNEFVEVGKSFVLRTPVRAQTKLPSQTTP
jgi:hypothetical protein